LVITRTNCSHDNMWFVIKERNFQLKILNLSLPIDKKCRISALVSAFEPGRISFVSV